MALDTYLTPVELASFYRNFAGSNALGPNQPYEFAPNQIDADLNRPSSLDNQHVAYVTEIEVEVVGAGLHAMWPVADDFDYRSYAYFRADEVLNALPPRYRTRNRMIVPLGKAPHLVNQRIVRGQGVPQALLELTGIPYVNHIRPVVLAGAAGFQGEVRVTFRGFEYHVQDLPALVGRLNEARDVEYADFPHDPDARGGQPLRFTLPIPSPIDRDNWTALPAGRFQGDVKVWGFWRFSRNVVATQPGVEFALTNDDRLGGGSGNVANSYEDLGFPFDIENKALIVRGVGTRAGIVDGANTNARRWWIQVGDQRVPPLRHRLPYYRNQFHFGRVAPDLPDATGLYDPLPAFEGEKPLIYRNQGVFYVVAGGASGITANDILIQVNGILVELGGRVPGASAAAGGPA